MTETVRPLNMRVGDVNQDVGERYNQPAVSLEHQVSSSYRRLLVYLSPFNRMKLSHITLLSSAGSSFALIKDRTGSSVN
jgi:hypothetical protein